ncbi:MAG TPA: serine hydrolase domain-containing protein [Bosea sp. (in: a-proteobacteria)]|jgi:CubicO group peptidase (beta-lactamase class C family)|uniref:serine hydrolase domain-containing protein n=1 Tax=Bosea sp. (in: a-proteobacteria) TaxID=1871050 RepID=UPI002E13B479|nr:serine hydrolase domain-containing protein [Bosea sp. (in: a-proteobacteria)]
MLNWAQAGAAARSITEAWTRGGGPGGAIVLFDGEGVRDAAGGGYASVEGAVAFTPDTPNRFASISKHFLATALLRAGFDLEARLGDLLSDLPATLAEVPLGRALDMTAALPDMMEVFWQAGVPFTATLSAADIRAMLNHFPGLNGTPGEEMAYSNTGWRLAQVALERRAAIPYAQIIAELVAPLDLAIRFTSDETEIIPGLASGYWHDGDGWRRGRYGLHFSASGGMAGSAAALARWCSALLSGRDHLAGVIDRLVEPRRFNDGSASAYRLGLVETRLGEIALVGHGGSLPGYRNHMLMAPAQGVGVVVMTNREEDALWLTLQVLARLLGQDLPPAPQNAPTGLFAAEAGPVWAELTPDAISFNGGFERLVADQTGGLRSLPAYLDIQLTPDGPDSLEGRIGGVRRRLSRVPPTPLDPRLPGSWRERNFDLALTIRPDGTARLPWAGGIGFESRLTPLPGGRALADLVHGPWRHRPCLWLQPDGTLRVASHRARILHFERVPEGDLS